MIPLYVELQNMIGYYLHLNDSVHMVLSCPWDTFDRQAMFACFATHDYKMPAQYSVVENFQLDSSAFVRNGRGSTRPRNQVHSG